MVNIWIPYVHSSARSCGQNTIIEITRPSVMHNFLPRFAEQWIKGALLYEHREWSHINVFSYNIHGVSMYKFKKIGNYESVIYINTNDKGKFWSSSLFSLSYTFTIIIVLFLSWKAEHCPSFQIRFSLRTWEQIVHNTASVLHSNVFLTV